MQQRSRAAVLAILCHAGLLAQTSWSEFVAKGDQAIVKGEYRDAEQYFKAALIQLGDSPVADRSLATILSRQGCIRHLLGDFESAITLLRKAIEIGEQEPGSERDVANDLYNLGQAQCELGRYDAAELSLKRSLTLSRTERPESGIYEAELMTWLGIVYTRQARYIEAERTLSAALTMLQHAPDQRAQVLTQVLNSMAELHTARGDLKSAEPLFKQVLGIYEKELGTDHPTTAISLSNLASLYLRQGRRASAKPLLQRALQIQERAFGPEHPQVANTLQDLGLLNALEGRYGIAESLLMRALAIEEKVFGTTYPRLALTLNQLALVYVGGGKYRAAEPVLDRAVAVGSAEPVLTGEVALAKKYLALVYKREAKFAQAELAYQQAIDLWQKVVAPNDPRLLSLLREYLSLIRRDRKPEMHELQERIKALETRKSFWHTPAGPVHN